MAPTFIAPLIFTDVYRIDYLSTWPQLRCIQLGLYAIQSHTARREAEKHISNYNVQNKANVLLLRW